jgi:hypothetical protein
MGQVPVLLNFSCEFFHRAAISVFELRLQSPLAEKIYSKNVNTHPIGAFATIKNVKGMGPACATFW